MDNLNNIKRNIEGYSIGLTHASFLVNILKETKKLTFEEDHQKLKSIADEVVKYLVKNKLTDTVIYNSVKDFPSILDLKKVIINVSHKEVFLNAQVSLFTQGEFLALNYGLAYPRTN